MSTQGDIEWGVRYPDGTTAIHAKEASAARIVDKYPDALALVRRPLNRIPWTCAICDGYGVLDGLEPCPGNALGVCSRTT